MPYLRMFLGEQQIEEVFIAEVLFNSVIGLHIVEEEKQNMLKRYKDVTRKSGMKLVFYLDEVPSATNNFTPLDLKKDS